MRKAIPFVLGIVSIAAIGSMFAAAQEMTAMPKILEIQREFIKPGKAGIMHDKSESNFVQAMARANWPTHYIALNSMSGKSRALYLTGYDSFEAWQKDNDAEEKNAALSAAIDHASVADGDLLDGFDAAVTMYQEDMSYQPKPDLSNIKYIEVMAFVVKPGHYKDWTDLVKMYIDGHKKAGTSANWATFEIEYGAGNEYLVLSADTSLADIDHGFADGKKFQAALGADGMKKLEELTAAAIESTDAELFSINPRQSYPPTEWVKANPDFWKPKPMAAMKPAAPAAKPAQ